MQENRQNPATILHPLNVSYTLSFTRKVLYLLEVWGAGVGNVGNFIKKKFLEREVSVGFHPSFSMLGIINASIASALA